jgi:glutathione S-transferase
MMRAMIKVHHLENSRSQRVLFMLEELGVPYELERYRRHKETMLAPPELRALHPLGKSPIVTDGDAMLAESGAILEYLVERYGEGRFVPARGTPAHLRYRYWLHYAEGSLMPLLLLKLVTNRIAKAPAPFFVQPIKKAISRQLASSFVDPQLTLHLDFIEGELGKSTWFAGDDLTAADVQMSFPLEAATARASDKKRPRIESFVERVHARPAYTRALEKGGPMEALS